MATCYYGTTGSASNPWDEACRQHEAGEISTQELLSIAHDLFDGEALQDVIVDVIHADLRKQPFIVQDHEAPSSYVSDVLLGRTRH